MRFVRTGFEFGMELHPDEKGMLRDLNRLHQSPVRGNAAGDQAQILQFLSVIIIKFVAMPMSFCNLFAAVTFLHQSAFSNDTGIGAQS